MYVPVIFFGWLPVILSPQTAGTGHFHILLVSFSLLYLYVIPFYYFTGKQLGSISRGINFLIRTISSSTPLILVVLLLETSLLLVQYKKSSLLAYNTFLYTAIDFTTYLVASIIDFILFIILILILKNEFGKDNLA